MSNDNLTLITKDLQEFVGDSEELKKIMSERQIRTYFGVAPTGRIHVGYFVPLLKVADFLEAGCHVKVLLADLHAFLDARKSSLDVVNSRSEYYAEIIKEVLELLMKVDTKNLEFVKGTTFQLSSEYSLDVYKALSFTNLHDSKHAGADVVRQSDNPMMNSLIYPTLQALDEQYLNTDIFPGGVDQRKICMYSRSLLPQLGYRKRMYCLTPMIPALSTIKDGINSKMSSSHDTTTKIDLLDDKKTIKKKISATYCLEGYVEDNTTLILVKKIIFPILKRQSKLFLIERPEKYGGNIEYKDYDSLESDFASKKLHPADFKNGASTTLNSILEPLREKLLSKDSFNELLKKAYA